MNIGKPTTRGSVVVAILVAIIGGLLITQVAYHVHFNNSYGSVDDMRSAYGN